MYKNQMFFKPHYRAAMRKLVSGIILALLLSPIGRVLGADFTPASDSVGDLDKTLPPPRKLNHSPSKILKMAMPEFLKHAKTLTGNHKYEQAIKILKHRLESEPANEELIAALVYAHKKFADNLCLHKEFERATTEYKAALSLLSI